MKIIITEQKIREFEEHLKWFYKSSLFTQEEKDSMADRINKQLDECKEKYMKARIYKE